MSNSFAPLALALAVSTVPSLLCQSPSEQPLETAVQRTVREAKEKGINKVERLLSVDYPVLRSLDAASHRYDFVIAVPIAVTTHVGNDTAMVHTVYKFRLEKFVLRQEDRSLSAPFRRPKKSISSFELPPDLLPLASGEFLLPTYGGTIAIDGVELVTSSPGEPRFQLGETYLLILNFADLEDRLAALPMAGYCVSRIEGDQIIPAIPTDRNPLARDIVALFRGSLRRLEFALPRRP